MAFMDAPCALGLGCRVNTEKKLHDLTPIGAVGVEQTHVELDMRAVVFGELVPTRRGFVKRLNNGLASPPRAKCKALSYSCDIAT